VLKELQSQIGEYQKQKKLTQDTYQNLLDNREKWQAALVTAKKTPELKMVQDAEIQLRQ
jgi:hypothetical protein